MLDVPSSKVAKFRIAILCSNRWNSAITEYAISTFKALLGDDAVDVVFVALKDKPCFRRARQANPSRVYGVDSFGLLEVGKFKRILQSNDVNILICFGGAEHTFSLFIKRWIRNIKILRFFGYVPERSIFKDFKRRYESKNTSMYILPAEWMKGYFEDLKIKNIIKIGMGIDEGRFYFQGQSSHTAQSFTALIFGRLDPIKGHREFLQLWKNVLISQKQKDPNRSIVLKIIGREENLKKVDIEHIAADLGLDTRSQVIIDICDVQDVPQLMSSIDLGIISSIGSEILVRVAQEFLMVGTKVLVSNVNTLPEVIFEKPFSGNVFDYNNQTKSIQIINQMIDEHFEHQSSSQRELLSQKARELFGLKTMREKLRALLVSLP